VFDGLLSFGGGWRYLSAEIDKAVRINRLTEVWLSYSFPVFHLADLTITQHVSQASLDPLLRYNWLAEANKKIFLWSLECKLSLTYSKFYDPYILNNVDLADAYQLAGLPIARNGQKMEFSLETMTPMGDIYLTAYGNEFADDYIPFYSPKQYTYLGLAGMYVLNIGYFSLIGKVAWYPAAYIDGGWMPGAPKNAQYLALSYSMMSADFFLTYGRIDSVWDREGGGLGHYPASDILNLGAAYNFDFVGLNCRADLKINYLNSWWHSQNLVYFEGKRNIIPLFPEFGFSVAKNF